MSDQSNNRRGNPESEHRDADLAGLFDADQVPQHGPDFWSGLQGGMAQDRTAPLVVSTNALPDIAQPDIPQPDIAQPGVGQSDDDIALLDVRPITTRRRSVMPLLIAAASIAVVGLGIAVLTTAANDRTSVDAADVTSTVSDVAIDTETPTTAVSDGVTTTVPESDASDTSMPSTGPSVDYFDRPTVTRIGPGDLVGYSPDGLAALIVDYGPSPETGCEGGQLLTLYAQILATGERRIVLPQGLSIETGGINLMVVSDGTAPPDQHRIYWTDYCDGVRSGLWSARMLADGTIEDWVTEKIDSLSDPFTPSGVPTANSFGALALSPDRSLGLFVTDDGAAVRVLGGNGQEWRLEGEMITNGSFDPTGQVVTLVGPDVVHLWSFRAGERTRVAIENAIRARFDESGRMVSVLSLGPEWFVSMVTFAGDLPPAAYVRSDSETNTPAEAPEQCSGNLELAPLSADELVAEGLPVETAATVVAIDTAAASCDWTTLSGLVAENFTASFGGGDAIELWQSAEVQDGVMDTLRLVLRQPFAPSDEPSRTYSWPEVFLRESCDDYTDRDRQSLVELGYSAEQITFECENFGSYSGYRVGIDAAGQWWFFVGGD